MSPCSVATRETAPNEARRIVICEINDNCVAMCGAMPVCGDSWIMPRIAAIPARSRQARRVCLMCVPRRERSTPQETPRRRRERVTRPRTSCTPLRPTPTVLTSHTTHTLFRNVHRHTTKTIPPPTKPLIHVAAGNLYACTKMMRVGTPINYLASAGMLALGSAAHE